MNEICHGYRPPLKDYIPSIYRELIESCWSQNPTQRPTFDEIVKKLKTNPNFITENIDYDEFINYTDYIDELLLEKKYFCNLNELNIDNEDNKDQPENFWI